MRDNVLNHFRDLAEGLSQRPRINITIILKNDRQLKATFDPMFKTVTIGGMTFPERELSTWTKLCWGSTAARIIKPAE